LVPDPHRPHEVAGLVVAHPIPVVGRVLRLHQVIKAEGGGLRLQQPVARTRHRRRIFSAARRVNPCHATRVRLKYGYGHLTASRRWSPAPRPKTTTPRTSVTPRRRSRRLTGPPIRPTSLSSTGSADSGTRGRSTTTGRTRRPCRAII